MLRNNYYSDADFSARTPTLSACGYGNRALAMSFDFAGLFLAFFQVYLLTEPGVLMSRIKCHYSMLSIAIATVFTVTTSEWQLRQNNQ
jgi:hypothetical protein